MERGLMILNLPNDFLSVMKETLRDDYDSYFEFLEKAPYRGMRINTLKADVEFIRKAPQSVAKRVFSEQELKTAKWLSPNDSDDRLFFRFWTAKESYTKFIGDGLAFSFKKIYLTLTPYKNQHNI